MSNYRTLVAACSAEYIAPIEADDVWLSTTRLEILHSYLVGTKLNFCFNQFLLNEGDQYRVGVEALSGRYRLLSPFDLIKTNYPASFTNCFYRRDTLMKSLEATKASKGYDWVLNTFIAANHSEMGFVPHILSSYYISPFGAWSALNNKSKAAKILESIAELKALLPPKFRSALEAQSAHIKKTLHA